MEPYRALVVQLRREGVEIAAIWQRLRERGYEGGYAAVWRFVRRLEPRTPEAPFYWYTFAANGWYTDVRELTPAWWMPPTMKQTRAPQARGLSIQGQFSRPWHISPTPAHHARGRGGPNLPHKTFMPIDSLRHICHECVEQPVECFWLFPLWRVSCSCNDLNFITPECGHGQFADISFIHQLFFFSMENG